MRRAILKVCPKCKKSAYSYTVEHFVNGLPNFHPDDTLRCHQCNATFPRKDLKNA